MIALDRPLSPHLRAAADEAIEAEAGGAGAGWIPETVTDPFPAAGAALLATDRLRVGTAIVAAFARSPFVTAQAAWELARASDGRFALGLGSQVRAHCERRFSVAWEHPAERLRDHVLAIRSIWRSFQEQVPLRYEGRFTSHTLLTDHFDPGPIEHPDVPILLAGVNPGMARLVGEVADGLVAHPLHSRRYLTEVMEPAIAAGAATSGRDRGELEVLVPLWVVSGRDGPERDAARTAVRRQIAAYGSTSAYRRVFEVHGWEGQARAIHDRAVERSGDPVELVTDEMVEAFALCAGPDELAAALERRLGGVADRVMLYPPLPESIDGGALSRLAADLAADRGPGAPSAGATG